MKRPLTVRPGYQPHEIALVVSALLASLGGLVAPYIGGGAGPLSTVERAFGPIGDYVWFASLLAGSIITGFGLMQRTINGLLTERVGLYLLAGLCTSYGYAALAFNGYHGLIAGIFVFGYGVASFARARQITGDLGRLERALADPTYVDDPPPLADPEGGP